MLKRAELSRRLDYTQATQTARLLKTFRAANLDARAVLLVTGTREVDETELPGR